MDTLETIEERDMPVVDLKPVRHGLRPRAMMLPGENRRDFNQLCDSLELEWRPRTPAEHFVEYDASDKNPDTLSQILLLDRLMQCPSGALLRPSPTRLAASSKGPPLSGSPACRSRDRRSATVPERSGHRHLDRGTHRTGRTVRQAFS